MFLYIPFACNLPRHVKLTIIHHPTHQDTHTIQSGYQASIRTGYQDCQSVDGECRPLSDFLSCYLKNSIIGRLEERRLKGG